VDNLRFHNQEMATLRQLQMVRRSADDTAGILSRLLENTAEVLDCDWLILHLQQDSVRPGTIIRGRQADSRPGNKTLNELTALLRDEIKPVLRTPGDGFTLPIGISSLAAVPVLTTSGKYLGSLAACRLDSNSFEARSVHILETTASQVSLLLENEQKILEMEYRVVMDERSRLAREIHDGLAQNLAFLKLQTAQMNGLLTRGELEELGEMIRTNQQVLTDAYAETRQAINHLRLFPQPGVRSWLNEMVQDFRQRGETTIELSIQKDPETLPVEIQLQLIRILQEALNNIRKHSRAQQVQISIRGYENDLILEIHDDGRGFLPEDLPSLSQYGLRGMRERSEMIGAEFQIISQPGGGTTIRLQLPYAFTEEAPL
jgi:two-component system nitrate/nitrite sensor histidine kinase NarX